MVEAHTYGSYRPRRIPYGTEDIVEVCRCGARVPIGRRQEHHREQGEHGWAQDSETARWFKTVEERCLLCPEAIAEEEASMGRSVALHSQTVVIERHEQRIAWLRRELERWRAHRLEAEQLPHPWPEPNSWHTRPPTPSTRTQRSS